MLVPYMRVHLGMLTMWRYVAPSLYSLKCMIATCEEFAKKHQITFNPTKSKLLCFNECDVVTVKPTDANIREFLQKSYEMLILY